MKTTLIAAALLAASTQIASASSTPGIDARERHQARRIYDGVASGRLTFSETARLSRGQAHIHAMERRAKSDGVVTPFERARIHAAQSRQSWRIWRLKHN